MVPVKLELLLRGIAEVPYADETVTEVVTDSRKAGPGKVFVAMIGERFDGNDFASSALEAGAVCAVVSRDLPGDRYVKVENTFDAYAAMARNYRRQFSPRIVGITGSVGKTTTKDMTAAVLSAFGKTLKSEGNRNNEVGMPETVLMMDGSEDFAVFEMSMSDLGEVSRLSRCAEPDVGVITCIGVSHIENLGSRENILKAKLEIADGMREDGLLVLNGDDDMLRSALGSLKQRVITFGTGDGEYDVKATGIDCGGYSSRFRIEDREYGSYSCVIPAAGVHSVRDALAAFAVGTRLGLDPAGCAAALADYRPSGMRQRFHDWDGVTIIEDCYNANPDSMRACLMTLADLPCEGKRIAVLGDMLELGSVTDGAHIDAGLRAAGLGIDLLLTYGEKMKLAAAAALGAGMEAYYFDSKKELAERLLRTARKGDLIAVKGSRGMEMEEILEILYRENTRND